MRLEVICGPNRTDAGVIGSAGITKYRPQRHRNCRNGRIYLNFMQIDFSVFQSLMAEIRRIQGVVDVRTVHFMPSEREQRAMWALLESLEDPILSLDLRGNIELANSAALSCLPPPKSAFVSAISRTISASSTLPAGLRMKNLRHTRKASILKAALTL